MPTAPSDATRAPRRLPQGLGIVRRVRGPQRLAERSPYACGVRVVRPHPGGRAALSFDAAVTASIFGTAEHARRGAGREGRPALKPERSGEIEGGADMALLDSRLRLGLTLYDKTTKDALVNRNVPPHSGPRRLGSENIGTVTDKGIEVSLGARALDRPASDGTCSSRLPETRTG